MVLKPEVKKENTGQNVLNLTKPIRLTFLYIPLNFSVNLLTSLEELNKKVEYKLKLDQERGKDRDFLGVVYTTCENVRSIKTNDNIKAFCVYDTGNKHDISHADICQTISSRVEGSRMRFKLRKAFSEKPVTLDVVFTTANNRE
ncbi:hypothetical protein WJM97_07300 [Okeanomitos corallinicola TIOX110]|uniref:Uncharacterized protein n=1 Tax=Okeanomitos corallinicola TIOX110 TaxID=3133117 RepID=A0ABZ2UX59_9CYAN